MANTIFKIVKKPIFSVLILALFLRLWGITYGLPLFLVNDETPLVYGSLKMIELKTLIPAFHQEEFSRVLYYAPLPSYVFLVVLSPVIGAHWFFSGMPSLAEYKLTLALDPSFIWVAARIFIAIIGIIDVAVIYFFARRIFKSERTAILSALFLALSFYHIQLSHNVRHWLPAAFLLTLIWFLSVYIYEGRVVSWKRYFGIGILIGAVTGGVNTAAVIGLIPPIFASFFRIGASGRTKFEFRKLSLLIISFVLVAILFVALHPYGLTRAEGASGPASDVAGRFAVLAEKSFTGWAAFVAQYIRALWNFEAPLFLSALIGMCVYLWGGRRFWALTVLLYSFSFFTLLYLFDDFTARGIIFITPILAVFAGFFADNIFAKLSELSILNSRVLRIVFYSLVFTLFFGWQLIIDFRYDFLLSRHDTRLAAIEWIDANIPIGSKVVMDGQYIRIMNTKDGIRQLASIDSSALRAADKALISLPDERYPLRAYHVININFVSKDVRAALSGNDFFRKNGFKFLVVEYPNDTFIAGDTRRIVGDAKLLQRFSPWKIPHTQSFDGSGKIGQISILKLFNLQRLGLFVDIYEL